MIQLVYCNERYAYKGYNGAESYCHLQIGRKLGNIDNALIVLSELEDNPGTSVTNRTEYLVTWICREFHISPKNVRVIEYYTAKPAIRRPEMYAEVTYRWGETMAHSASWKYMQLDQALELLSQYGLKEGYKNV